MHLNTYSFGYSVNHIISSTGLSPATKDSDKLIYTMSSINKHILFSFEINTLNTLHSYLDEKKSPQSSLDVVDGAYVIGCDGGMTGWDGGMMGCTCVAPPDGGGGNKPRPAEIQ